MLITVIAHVHLSSSHAIAKRSGQWPQLMHQNDGHFRHRAPWRGSGLAVPVFSLRSRSSVGCGEFRDLKLLVDFVAACGMHVLQVSTAALPAALFTTWVPFR